MKKALLLFPALLLVLGACNTGNPQNSASESGGDHASTSETEGPSQELANVAINKAIPTGWTYISNNPETYPDPAFYSVGSLKLNFAGMGIQSPAFGSSAKTVKLVGTLNTNTKTEGDATTIAVEDMSGTILASKMFSATGLTTFDETLTLTTKKTQFKIILTANKGYNIGLATIVVNS